MVATANVVKLSRAIMCASLSCDYGDGTPIATSYLSINKWVSDLEEAKKRVALDTM
jgi:hypothetical protein